MLWLFCWKHFIFPNCSALLCIQVLVIMNNIFYCFYWFLSEFSISQWLAYSSPVFFLFFQISVLETEQQRSMNVRSSSQFWFIDLFKLSDLMIIVSSFSLQWHSLESSRGKEVDWRKQLATKNGSDHNMEPCHHGEDNNMCFLWLKWNKTCARNNCHKPIDRK